MEMTIPIEIVAYALYAAIKGEKKDITVSFIQNANREFECSMVYAKGVDMEL